MSISGSRRAVVLDPHPLWGDVVAQVVKKVDVEVVGQATTCADALALINELKPELLIAETNIGPEGAAGLALVRRVRAFSNDADGVRVIVLSSRSDSAYIQAALNAGAKAYVVKSTHPDDLALAVRQAFRLSVYFQPMRPRAKAAPRPDRHPQGLTRREREILALVVEGMANAKIAETLWITEQTVKFHLSNIYRKLRVVNRTEAARWAHVNGLVLDTRSEPVVA
jgi:NarL family two-component system response regulator LiaR